MSAETTNYLIADGEIELNVGRRTATLEVANTADRAVQVGSHFHFFEVNRGLEFDRTAAFGMRLDIPAGTAARFEPGARRLVHLVALGGTGRVLGLNGLTNGSVLSNGSRGRALQSLQRWKQQADGGEGSDG